ncbi:MAG: tRNA uridine-5-carboxymethylaminomethyl(34) synthesis enzyme MnmG [Clostridiales bacterium]|nr:tRNA uridine-5-carboxymethylaminomethyl(34) synthesis enzyme MnmG [Clostridiales bacterium]
MLTKEYFDLVVVGAGHAGCEAALAGARMGQKTLLLTLNLDSVALMPCNPAIGGTAKGHLVREVDALGGEMGKAIDDTFIQSRMLNTGKGPAVYSLRAQADKAAYKKRMRDAIENQVNLILRQGEVTRLVIENGVLKGVETATGSVISCGAAVLCTGVYLKSRIIIGQHSWEGGPQGLVAATGLTQSLIDNGFEIRRFKTGTPARVDVRTLDFSKMTPQYGDDPIVPFSFLTESEGLQNKAICYLTYTTEHTHEIIRNNLHLSPMYSGSIKGTGARYCPSIEDKVVRFADKDRHPLFIEPEGLDTIEWYVQGMSSSLPEDVQREMYHSVPGMENAELMRLAYAIEYDCINPMQLDNHFKARNIEGLYFAGQINGTSGYEEAAAQGLYAGINASLFLKGEEPLTLNRANSYIGVLIDDLTTKGTDEPYRMMTSRAEYRLLLRQDNADMRLTEMALRTGLISDERLKKLHEKKKGLRQGTEYLKNKWVPPTDTMNQLLESKGETKMNASARLSDLIKRPSLTYDDLRVADENLPDLRSDAKEQTEIELKYEGYISRQQAETRKFLREEQMALPQDLDYMTIDTLRIEARQKLNKVKPASLGQASRIPGVSPGDITVLMILMEKRRREERERAKQNT